MSQNTMVIKKVFVLSLFIFAAIGLRFADLYYATVNLDKLFFTAVTIAAAYFVFRLLLEEAVAKKIQEAKTRYSFRKTTQILFLAVSFVIVLRIWVVNPQALFVAYGLATAGVAIALQDLFKNFAGGIVIFLTGMYHVGNRIEIGGKYGDVLDIGIFYTALMEIREWVDGDQATGRITTIPNGAVLTSAVQNYTKDHHFLWDEIFLPVTYESDWKKAVQIMENAAQQETERFTEQAKQSLSYLEERYYLSDKTMKSSVFMTLTDNWIGLNVRYAVEVRERREVNSALFTRILEELQKHPSIQVASENVVVSQGPPMKGL